ncbi:MAG: ADP-forming succinate--CoA ligase subunit beta [Hyphomicrobiaceae bacterium]
MNLYEFQAKELLARFGIDIPRGRVADSAEDALKVAHRLAFPRFVVKAQVHAGERGAGGGIRFASDPADVATAAADLIGRTLATAQTGPGGQSVKWVYLEEAIAASFYIYAAVMLDRTEGQLVLLASAAGGDDFERRVGEDPSLVVRVPLRVGERTATGEFAAAAGRIGMAGETARHLARLFETLAQAAVTLDATLIEINPLAATAEGRLVALDAKTILDDNALHRHPDLAALREAGPTELGDPLELAADRHQINYLRMDGDIGVVVNGAGLALATLDELIDAGGRPANFMDIRTTASSLDIAYGFELILSNPRTRAVLVNVHGGGMQRCDTIVEGIGVAVRRTGRSLPMVVRLAGNNAEFARTRLESYGIRFTEAADMGQAAACIVQLPAQEAGFQLRKG